MPRRSPEYIFNREYVKLVELCEKITEHELSELALSLRKLLLEGFYKRAGRQYRFKARFIVTDFDHKAFKEMEKIIGGTGYFMLGHGDLLYPEEHLQFKTRDLSWKEFIDFPLGSTNGFSFTVRDLIKFEAHVQGAVHYRKPKVGLEEAIEKNTFFIGNLPMTLRQLRAIAFVVKDALAPLYEMTKKVLT